MIKIERDNENEWYVWDTKTGRGAYIVSFKDACFINGSTKTRYRVDSRGRTVDSMINHFSTAKSIAIKHIKGAF